MTKTDPVTSVCASTLRRFSSRREHLGHAFLRDRLIGATSYDRLAGYFRSSVLEVAGEEIEAVAGKVRMVCNGDLNPLDIETARAAVSAITRKWMEFPPELETKAHRRRYGLLFDLLRSGKLEVRVLPAGKSPFLHGKAGVIRRPNGDTAFMGSVNETNEGWSHNYEILWEDSSAEGVAWVQEEFDALFDRGIPLPDTVIGEIGRLANRVEYASIADWRDAAGSSPKDLENLAASAMVEAPVYRSGECLYPWQKNFVSMVLRQRHRHGKARLLLADEVGLGKTLSLGAAALLTALLGDGAVLLLVPATLTEQWQGQLWARLGIPTSVWTAGKCWVDQDGRNIGGNGEPEGIVKCPSLIGIVSTGLIVQPTRERALLLGRPGRYGCVILDEAHKARREDMQDASPRGAGNNLLEFMREIAAKAATVLLGTATPIQVDPIELWDLVDVLGRDADFVFGDRFSRWRQSPSDVLNYVAGRLPAPKDPVARYDLVANPLPSLNERPSALFEAIRGDLMLDDGACVARGRFAELSAPTRDALENDFDEAMVWSNPLVLHTVLRKRSMIEEKIDPRTGEPYLRKIAVRSHPRRELTDDEFSEGALKMPRAFRRAYEAAETFCDLLGHRVKAAGFFRTLLLRRIGSSVAAGLSTAKKLLDSRTEDEDDDTPVGAAARQQIRDLAPDEKQALRDVVRHLESLLGQGDGDPKGRIVARFLTERPDVDGRTWLDHGCIVFTQYFDSADWLARYLASKLPDVRIGVYAGSGRSMVIEDGIATKLDRNKIKDQIEKGVIRLVIATDAACEGLNLQTLGTLANLDLPWNPAKFEQRKGRIQRIGQTREAIDILSLRYERSVEDNVYDALSSRMQNIWDMFGQFPDAFEADWTKAILAGREEARKFINGASMVATNRFDLRYRSSIEGGDWESCSKVLSRQDLVVAMSKGW